MTLLDAYALVAFVVGGPARDEVRALLHRGDVGVATANVIEAIDVTARREGLPPTRTRSILEPLFDGPLTVFALDLQVAWRAAELRAAYYDRGRRLLSLADCILLATAGASHRIATADRSVLEVADAEGIAIESLSGP